MGKIQNSHIKCIILNQEFLQNNKKLAFILLKLMEKNLSVNEVDKIINNYNKNNY
jgi:hypothetical protein